MFDEGFVGKSLLPKTFKLYSNINDHRWIQAGGTRGPCM